MEIRACGFAATNHYRTVPKASEVCPALICGAESSLPLPLQLRTGMLTVLLPKPLLMCLSLLSKMSLKPPHKIGTLQNSNGRSVTGKITATGNRDLSTLTLPLVRQSLSLSPFQDVLWLHHCHRGPIIIKMGVC